ncbi:MAG TPA: metal ABC transporter permease [Chloroflexi bacterium]|nr:metal ABC transporter permease [Chloroflexota bacterium]
MSVLQYDFMQHALAAGLLVSIACGIVGTYVVVRRMVFISGGISHATFGGIGLAYFLGFNPIAGAMIFAIPAALATGMLSRQMHLSEDTGIGILWATGMALGVVFVGLSEGYAPDLFSYLFGNILTVKSSELLLMLVLDMVIIITVLAFYKEFAAISFDEEFSRAEGIPTGALNMVLLGLIALTIVMVIRVVGIVLVIALLSIPPAIARQYTHRLRTMMLLAAGVSALLATGGVALSYLMDLSSGATIILLGGVVLLLVMLERRGTRHRTTLRTDATASE